MQITTVDPATGRTLAAYPVLERPAVIAMLERVHAAFLDWRSAAAERAALRVLGRAPAPRPGLPRPPDDLRDGQDHHRGPRRGREVRLALRSLRGARRGLARGSGGRGRRPQHRVAVRAAGRGAVDHALELPVLAGSAVRRAHPGRGQHQHAQAREQRHGLRAGDRRRFARRGFRQMSSGRSSPITTRSPRSSPTRSRGPLAHRQHRGGAADRRTGGTTPQEGACWNSGAATRSSCWRTPTSSGGAGAVRGRMLCTGQSCIAAKRFIVEQDVAEEFSRRFAEMATLRVGDPLDDATQVGAIVNERELQTLQAQLQDALDHGARDPLRRRPARPTGLFLRADGVVRRHRGMRVAGRGLRADRPGPGGQDADEAVRVANATEFGLGGSVWTRDREPRRGASRVVSPAARCSSTASSRAIPGCRSAASSRADWAGNSAGSA